MFPEFRSPEDYLAARPKGALNDAELVQTVNDILVDVQQNGDEALQLLTERFDGAKLPSPAVSREQIKQEFDKLAPQIRRLLTKAISNIQLFHEKQLPKSWLTRRDDQSRFGMQFTSIDRVGCYVPGGRAGYPSTVIMTVVPAQLAGVKEVVLASPPDKSGQVNSLVLATAGLLGVEEIYAVGGAQAIAALALGTQSIKPVDKIVGPGNAYVNEAKRQLFGVVGIDSLAGPTEVMILADTRANPEYIVQDLFAQAEHDPNARAILITDSTKLRKEVQTLASELINKAGRKTILERAIKKYGALVLVKSIEHGVQLVNAVAPEHLQIMVTEPERILAQVNNAGAIFIGSHTPVAVGDYFAGPNHVLPTGGTARFSSPLSVFDFTKFSSVLEFSQQRLATDRSAIADFAELEGFPNHRDSVLCRK